MQNRSFRVALSALFLAGAMGFVTIGAADAQSVMRQCGDEWKTAKANNATNGQTWPEFLKSCRAQKEAVAAPTAAPAPAPAAVPAPAPAPAPAQIIRPRPTVAARPTAAGQFSSEAEAKARCPADNVVWVNSETRVYHSAGTRYYGATKRGAYMCEADANAAGDRASKSRMGKPKPQQQ
jgi:hypothetical protein